MRLRFCCACLCLGLAALSVCLCLGFAALSSWLATVGVGVGVISAGIRRFRCIRYVVAMPDDLPSRCPMHYYPWQCYGCSGAWLLGKSAVAGVCAWHGFRVAGCGFDTYSMTVLHMPVPIDDADGLTERTRAHHIHARLLHTHTHTHLPARTRPVDVR